MPGRSAVRCGSILADVGAGAGAGGVVHACARVVGSGGSLVSAARPQHVPTGHPDLPARPGPARVRGARCGWREGGHGGMGRCTLDRILRALTPHRADAMERRCRPPVAARGARVQGAAPEGDKIGGVPRDLTPPSVVADGQGPTPATLPVLFGRATLVHGAGLLYHTGFSMKQEGRAPTGILFKAVKNQNKCSRYNK